MIKYLFSLGFFLAATAANSYGQTEPIEADRPGESENPSLLLKNYIQLEAGFTLENENPASKNYSYPTALWRYGLTQNLELRLIIDYVSEKENAQVETGLKPITVGLKAKFCEQKGIIPATSFLGYLTTSNLGSKVFHTSYIAPAFRFAMQHELTDKISLTYNAGIEWNGETPEPAYVYTFAPQLSLSKKLSCYIEVYGFAPSLSKAQHSLDGGFTYLLFNDLQFDLSGDIGLTNNAADNYVSVGISYRLDTKR